jgi:NADPH:quinone reductase-like Zn-dependent oxidoreductase
MKAAVLRTLGQPPAYAEFAEPVPNPDEVRVHVRAAGLHPLVKAIASGKHYTGAPELPFVVGVDGVGTRDDGSRVYCGFARRPFGTMAERVVVPAALCVPLPDGLDDLTAAAIGNPGMSAWLSLTWKAHLRPGESVLVLGATGVAGRLALQFARLLGARRVVAAGRDPAALAQARGLGADATIQLDQPEEALVAAFRAETDELDVVVDYLWGPPTEALFKAIDQQPTRSGGRRIRHVEVGESAGSKITLPASILRGKGLEISGSGIGSASLAQITQAMPEYFALAAAGKVRIDLEAVPLAQVEAAWTRKTAAARIVFTVG